MRIADSTKLVTMATAASLVGKTRQWVSWLAGQSRIQVITIDTVPFVYRDEILGYRSKQGESKVKAKD